MAEITKVLGIDPGLTRMGIGAVVKSGDDIKFYTHGLIGHPRAPELTFNEHLDEGIQQIVNLFPRVLDLVTPSFIVSEYVPVGRLGSNSELVISAIVACKVIACQFGIPWYGIGANTVKKQMTGDDKASKAQIRRAVIELFPVVEARHATLKREQKQAGEKAEGLPQDVFDALAVAVVGSRKYGEQNSNHEKEEVLGEGGKPKGVDGGSTSSHPS